MRKIDKIKRKGQALAKAHGHGMSRWYHEVGGYWTSTCGYLCDCEMIIEGSITGDLELWGDALQKDCVHKE